MNAPRRLSCSSVVAAWAGACVGLALLASAGGCAHGADPGAYRAAIGSAQDGAVDEARAAAALGPGDVFDVRVYQEKELSGRFRVGPDGAIAFPLVGRVEVEGHTPEEVAELLRAKLADGYLRNPYVTVFVVEYHSKKVVVLGQVRKPGTFPYQEGMTVVQAISMAGGLTERAAPDRTLVRRKVDGKDLKIAVPVGAINAGEAPNFRLRPGDIVFVPESLL